MAPAEDVLKQKWGVRSPAELKQRCQQLVSVKYLIDGLLPHRSLGILIGDSGLGKSPLLHQVGLCVAAGVPFLDRAVGQGRVLYLAFEDGIVQVDQMIDQLTRHLGLQSAPQDFLTWNVNDCPPGSDTGNAALGMIRDLKPSLAIIDSLGAYCADIEEPGKSASQLYRSFRQTIRESGASILVSHHIRKPDQKQQPAPLEEEGNLWKWFLEARGPRALINGSDVRLGVDRPGFSGLAANPAGGQEIALVLRGFMRVCGEIPLSYLARVYDPDGEPLGYQRLTGPALLFNPDQQIAFANLPRLFRFKDAQRVYGKGAQATTDFLKKCINLGILRRGNQGYEKP